MTRANVTQEVASLAKPIIHFPRRRRRRLRRWPAGCAASRRDQWRRLAARGREMQIAPDGLDVRRRRRRRRSDIVRPSSAYLSISTRLDSVWPLGARRRAGSEVRATDQSISSARRSSGVQVDAEWCQRLSSVFFFFFSSCATGQFRWGARRWQADSFARR